MTLKDQITADLDGFVNVTEFAEVRDVRFEGELDARMIACVLDDSTKGKHNADGVFLSESLLHLRSDALPASPVIGQRLSVDGKLGNVVHVDEALGMLAVRLGWFES